jgi:hypothetical protein
MMTKNWGVLKLEGEYTLSYFSIIIAFLPIFAISAKEISKSSLLGLDPNSPHLIQEKGIILEKETYQAFKKMKQEFDSHSASNQKTIRLEVVSGYRSYDHQKRIWEEKYTGKRPMRKPVQGLTSKEIVDLILEFSSMPGISRHHWGTDIDFNSLDNHFFEKDKNGIFLFSWLEKNANKFGFCRPYNSIASRNNKGFQEEKWHWSYKPSSLEFWKEWLIVDTESSWGEEWNFLGSREALPRAREYVESISQDCR